MIPLNILGNMTVYIGRGAGKEDKRGNVVDSEPSETFTVHPCSVQPGVSEEMHGYYQGAGKVSWTVWAPESPRIQVGDLVILGVDYPLGVNNVWAKHGTPVYRVEGVPQRWHYPILGLNHQVFFLEVYR